jgi:RNA polymerase sigma-70 factor (ECF subfamily)
LAHREKHEPRGTLAAEGRLAPPHAGEPAHFHRDEDRYQEQLEALRRAQQGDQDACTWLMETHQKRVFNLVIRMLGCDRHTAADISQDVFLRAFRSIQSFDGQALFSTWLHKITMNLCISEYRRRRALKRDRPTLSIDAPLAGTDDLYIDPPARDRDPADQVHHRDIRSAVRAAIARLPEEFRECVLLRDMQGLSYEEIADVLDLPPGTVRSRIHRGRLLLQALLSDYMP